MLSDNLKMYREQKDMTQEDVAKRLNIVRQTLSKWEKGISAPDANMLEKIAGLYDVSVNELLGIEDVCNERLQEKIVSELERVNEQLKIRNQLKRRLWIVVMIIGIIIIVWGGIGAAMGIINYNALLGDMTFSEELKTMTLEGCMNAFRSGIRRIIIGVIIAVVAGVVAIRKR
ncbi:MAG: helix-turn-helix transcriptional regulator [Lachnospiraceae bacterium]|nr:helix-turn-helix transcriptional regulator [Lachnospiraceae bacterium]